MPEGARVRRECQSRSIPRKSTSLHLLLRRFSTLSRAVYLRMVGASAEWTRLDARWGSDAESLELVVPSSGLLGGGLQPILLMTTIPERSNPTLA